MARTRGVARNEGVVLVGKGKREEAGLLQALSDSATLLVCGCVVKKKAALHTLEINGEMLPPVFIGRGRRETANQKESEAP